MPNPLIVGFIVFALVLAGAFAGWTIQQRLPKHHLTEQTKNVVSVSMAVVATVSALVLGLLISNANTKFSALEGEVTALSAEILRLDQILRRYGPDTDPAREVLQQYAEQKTADLFPNDPAHVRLSNPSTYDLLQQLEDLLLALKPATPRDQWWLGQAMTLAAKMGDICWLLAQQIGQSTPTAFVALLVFWLALLFFSFGLFAPHNYTSAAVLTLCALAVARRRWDVPRIGTGLRRPSPLLATADASGSRGIANPIRQYRALGLLLSESAAADALLLGSVEQQRSSVERENATQVSAYRCERPRARLVGSCRVACCSRRQ